jgi:hypothetical protein
MPKQPRELPEPQHQDRKGEPKRTDAENRDLSGGEGDDRDASAPERCHGMIRLETCDQIRICRQP